MSGIVFGVGLGLVLLLGVWSLAILISVISFRTGRNIGPIVLIVALIFTGILLIVPLESKYPEQPVEKVSLLVLPILNDFIKLTDDLFFLRISVLLLLILSSVGGFGCYISHCMEPQVARLRKIH